MVVPLDCDGPPFHAQPAVAVGAILRTTPENYIGLKRCA
jgi:hypothetical protein